MNSILLLLQNGIYFEVDIYNAINNDKVTFHGKKRYNHQKQGLVS
jgi:hypothetical protein